MKDIFDPNTAIYFKNRIAQLNEESIPKWGKMNVVQMLYHCDRATKMACGDLKIKRVFIGRIIGKSFLKKITKDETPFGKNSPTAKELVLVDKSEFIKEKQALQTRIDEITAKNESDLDGIVHPFFGKMTGKEWNILVFKHLDHHLRQFGV